ncbi:hypothetical protein [Actomonas aquatica]|uniref:Glycosyltransferase RgtA/B/C/D-like domain-containing protein n=1 Tax=Actomonas aquatica TaxID=2866162 RepID=A0ABZ1C9B8_9BACT|nr:hypothetical protein [Opitutus sp. WL0086]WRQ87174.1 hypothetical protein K1X11_020370 [Opitutus sp. WL0086]
MPTASTSASSKWLLCGASVLAVLTAIAPWLRNHDYLRDFMDYGLVMAAAGRLADGQAAYVDFVTPIQVGFLEINRGVETLFGGTYLGMTYGALLLLLLGGGLLFGLLRRAYGVPAAILGAWIVTALTTAQHTIIWHNVLGVITMALATACMALLTRAENPVRPGRLILLLAACLWIGGVNKISFHLVAVAGCFALALRSILLAPAHWKRSAGLGLLTAIAGGALPLLTELGLTGASFAQWRYNVIELAAGDRAQYLHALADPQFYLRPLHNYYGDLHLPFIGAAIVALFAGLAVAGWPHRRGLDRFALLIAAPACAVAALAALATNQDIAWIALGMAVALALTLGLAFGVRLRPGWQQFTLLALAVVTGCLALESAWRGQRSQFGHEEADRSEYLTIDATDPTFAYLRGLHMPPALVESLQAMPEWLPAPDEAGRRSVFYSTSLEFLERLWPAIPRPGLPLWMHNDTSYQEPQRQLLNQLLSPPSVFDAVYDSVNWSFWPPPAQTAVELFTNTHFVGPVIRHRAPVKRLNWEADAMLAMNTLGINYPPELLTAPEEGSYFAVESGQIFYGSNTGQAQLEFSGISNQLLIRPVIKRLNAPIEQKVSIRFWIEYDIDGVWHPLWEQEVVLEPNQEEMLPEFRVDSRRRRIRLHAHGAQVSANDVLVGWFLPLMLHSVADSTPPPALYRTPSPERATPPSFTAAAIKSPWKPDDVYLRGGGFDEEGYWTMASGDQVWLRSAASLPSLEGVITPTGPADKPLPMVRILWYKGGRVQIVDQFNAIDAPRRFRAWSSGPEGWFGILLDTGWPTRRVRLTIDRVDSP